MKQFQLISCIVVVLVLVLVAMYRNSRSNGQSPKAKSNHDLLVFESTKLDAGKCLNDHEPKAYSFVCRNVSSSAVTIDSVEADCACSDPRFEKTIPPGEQSTITLTVIPTLNKRLYSATLRATQNSNIQTESLSILLDVIEPDSSQVDPPTLFLGRLVLDEPFSVEQKLRIATGDGKPLIPMSMVGPDWLKVDFESADDSMLLRISGSLPSNRNSTRGRIEIKLPPPNKDQSVEFVYSPRTKYEISPSRLFGSVRDLPTGRDFTLSDVTDEEIAFQVTIDGPGEVDISKGSDPTQFTVTPKFPDGCQEVGGKIEWSINTASGSLIAKRESTFLFMKLEARGSN